MLALHEQTQAVAQLADQDLIEALQRLSLRSAAFTRGCSFISPKSMRASFVSSDGRRCAQHGWLRLHHEDPYGRGGPATTGNIRVLCKSHNQLLAERDYGRGFMKQRIEQARRERATRQLAPEPEQVTQGP